MKQNKIILEQNGYRVVPNWEEINRLREIIDKTIEQSDVSYADALTSLCIVSVEIAYTSKIGKPQFLNRISNFWEELDSQNHERKDERQS